MSVRASGRESVVGGTVHGLLVGVPLGALGAVCLGSTSSTRGIQTLGFVLWLTAWLGVLGWAILAAPRSRRYAAGVGVALTLTVLGSGVLWLALSVGSLS